MSNARRGYFRMGVETTVGWPSKEQTVVFRGHRMILNPETDTLAASVTLRLEGQVDQLEARRVVQEFLSALSWARGGRIVEIMSMFSTAPIGIGKSKHSRHISDAAIDYLPEPSDVKAKLALALFREASSVNVVPYSFLGYFKIINLLHANGPDQIGWVNRNLSNVSDFRAVERVTELRQQHPDVGKYLYASGRCAIAHAHATPVVNPDEPMDAARLLADLPVVKGLAEYAIEHELGVKSQHSVWKEHLYELVGFRELWSKDAIDDLRNGKRVESSRIPVPTPMSLRLRKADRLDTFESMKGELVNADNGIVQLRLTSREGFLEAIVCLNFKDERLVFDALRTVIMTDDGSAKATDAHAQYYRFLRGWLANGETEVWSMNPEKLLGRADPVLLTNVMIDWDAVDKQIAALEAESEKRRTQRPTG